MRYDPKVFLGHQRYRGPEGTWVYLLLDPEDDTVRYVGVTNDPERRLTRHVETPQNNRCLREWIEGLVARGLSPVMVFIDRKTRPRAAAAEMKWIAYFRARGRIYNIHQGGPYPAKKLELTKLASLRKQKPKKRKKPWHEKREKLP